METGHGKLGEEIKYIDWTHSLSKLSKHFIVRDALFLPQWNRLANIEDGLSADAKVGLLDLFKRMDLVRDYLNSPIAVHVSFRPWKYNVLVGGAKQSAHVARAVYEDGNRYCIAAADWHAVTMSCSEVREKLVPKLEEFGLRMEDHDGNWIHTDNRPPGATGRRFFKP
jgi:hypothetical protein